MALVVFRPELVLPQGKVSSLQPVGIPLYPTPTIRFCGLTMTAPTWVAGSFDLMEERKAEAMKYSSQVR